MKEIVLPYMQRPFSGRVDVVKFGSITKMIVSVQGNADDTAMDSTYADWETTQGIASWLKVPKLNRKRIETGRKRIRELLLKAGAPSQENTIMKRLLPILRIRQTAKTKMIFSTRKLLKQSVLVIRHGSLLIASRLALREQIKKVWSIMASLKTSNRGTSFSQEYLITSGFFVPLLAHSDFCLR